MLIFIIDISIIDYVLKKKFWHCFITLTLPGPFKCNLCRTPHKYHRTFFSQYNYFSLFTLGFKLMANKLHWLKCYFKIFYYFSSPLFCHYRRPLNLIPIKFICSQLQPTAPSERDSTSKTNLNNSRKLLSFYTLHTI